MSALLGAALLLGLELYLGQAQNRLHRAYTRASHVPIIEAGGRTVFPAFVPWDMAFGRNVFSSEAGPVLPLTGLSGRLTGLCSASGKLLAFESDEFGFRNRTGAHTQAQIAIIGDSFAQGYCVSDSVSVAGMVRRSFPSTLNLGVTGAGPLWDLAVLREYAGAVRPRRVVWLFFEGNDLQGVGIEAGGFLRHYLDPSYAQGLRSRQHLIDTLQSNRLDSLADALLRPGAERFRRALLLKEIRARLSLNFRRTSVAAPSSSNAVGTEVDKLRRVLVLANETTAGWGGRILFVYLPERSRFGDAGGTPETNEGRRAAKEAVIDAARAAGADVLDLVPVFAAWKKPLGLWDEAQIHYNARGYRLAADAIVGELMRLDHASAAVDGGNENPQRSVPAAAEDFWIPVERVTLSMVRRATSYR